ncbi:non-structural maintenance of chromosomes element 1 homolog isoform X1 [Penaeus monodon]|uniref:non-structural maintenance of chromosomes element 1 homolog isoform X1 n=1 Tax=Penaeus monodon TaxID=6687 RepID=UPI0018A701EA|nr:non-structural maintenance of chromosomes element 1 homolog isoform X1 [Penaeus monodon]
MVYTNAHRLFLQILTSRRYLLGHEVQSTYKKCCAKFHVTADNLLEFVKEINEELGQINLVIRKSIQEDYESDSQCFVLVNIFDSDVTRMNSTFTSQELALFRKVIEAIVQSEDGSILITEAINMAFNLKQKMKIGESEALIDRLVQDGWLLQHTDQKILSLSALSTAELQTYLEEQYGDIILKCFFCKLVSLKGYSCTECDVKVHRQCGSKFWIRNGSQSPSCPDPKCAAEWSHVEVNLPRKCSKTQN